MRNYLSLNTTKWVQAFKKINLFYLPIKLCIFSPIFVFILMKPTKMKKLQNLSYYHLFN